MRIIILLYSLHSTGETLVLLRIVVLEANLQIDGLHELTLLGLLGILEHLGNALEKRFLRNFTKIWKIMRCEVILLLGLMKY